MQGMQNVVNYIVPFFGKDGKPLSGGRVHFVKPDCSAAPTDREDPDYIAIYDTDGTPLENPLGLDDLGKFQTQPFVADGIDFRMIVERPTGIPATLESEAPAWEQLYVIDSKSQKIEVSFSGVSAYGGLPDLRKADPESSPAVVLGYSEAGDFCPPRIFKWVGRLYDENYGTHVRSTLPGKGNAGTWVCEPSGFVDVRWFGVDPDGGKTVSDALQRASREYPNTAAYFPTGTYFLSSGLQLYAAIAERNAKFRCSGTNSVEVRIDSFFENRGGYFMAETSAADSVRVVPVVKGILRTSWLRGTLNEFLTPEALSGVETLVVDSVPDAGKASVAVSGRKVVLLESSPLSGITFSGCVFLDFAQGGALNTEIAGNGLTVGGRDSDDFSARLSDRVLLFVKDKDGNAYARFGNSGLVVADGSDRTEVVPKSVTSPKGVFGILEILDSLSVKGDASVGGNVTVGNNLRIADILETLDAAESGEAVLGRLKVLTGILLSGDLRAAGCIFAGNELQSFRSSFWSLLGSAFAATDPRTGLGVHYAKASDYGYTKFRTDVDKYGARVDLTGLTEMYKGFVIAIYNDINYADFSYGIYFKTDAGEWENHDKSVLLFMYIEGKGLVKIS